MGGTDQWGNITAGCELVRRVRGAQVHGLVWPLLTTASGAKFGKTEGGAVWLDPARTSPFRFYQFWLQTDDRDVVQHLKWFTFLSEAEVEDDRCRARGGATELAPRSARSRTAMTRLVHGDGELAARRARVARALRRAAGRAASLEDILTVFDDVPSVELQCRDIRGRRAARRPTSPCRSGLTASKGEATRLDQAGGPLCERPAGGGGRQRITAADLIGGRVAVLRKGQRERRVLLVNG